MPHLYPFLSSKRPYLQLFQQLQTLLHDKKKVIYLFSVTSPNIFGSPDKPGGLSIQLCKSEKKEFYIRYSS